MIRIAPVCEAEIDAVATVGPAAYAAAHHYLWPDPADLADLAGHLQSFGAAAVRNFLAQEGARIWLARVAGRPVGFLSLLPLTRPGLRQGKGCRDTAHLPASRGAGAGDRADVACARD
ncbi:MAG TPA: hypothetical protein VEZ70_08040 [Allosphingosinicella sp.]|nr:hypothetical protein [Allosphingosinicella sp.]